MSSPMLGAAEPSSLSASLLLLVLLLLLLLPLLLAALSPSKGSFLTSASSRASAHLGDSGGSPREVPRHSPGN